MKKYLVLSVALLAPGMAHAATVVTIPFSGAFGADAYGQYRAGDTFSGVLTYGRGFEEIEDATDTPYIQTRGNEVPLEISLRTSLESYTADNPYLTYFVGDKTLQFTNARAVPIFSAEFSNVPSDQNYFPTLEQLMGRSGVFSFTSRTGDDEFSGGSGFLTFEGTIVSTVPEPATWAYMFAGLALTGGAARYRRRKSKVTYA